MIAYSPKIQAAQPDPVSYSPQHLGVHRPIPRLESYERRRTMSDSDEQRLDPQSQRYQTPPLLNPRPRGYTDAYSTAATYGGDKARQGVRFSPNIPPIRSATSPLGHGRHASLQAGSPLGNRRHASLQAGGYSNAVTYNGSPDERTQRYVPPNPVAVAPITASTQTQPPFMKEAYCPRYSYQLQCSSQSGVLA